MLPRSSLVIVTMVIAITWPLSELRGMMITLISVINGNRYCFVHFWSFQDSSYKNTWKIREWCMRPLSGSDSYHASSDASLFSSSLPVLPHEKLKLNETENGYQSVDDVSYGFKKLHQDADGNGSLEDGDTHALGTMLPDDEDELLCRHVTQQCLRPPHKCPHPVVPDPHHLRCPRRRKPVELLVQLIQAHHVHVRHPRIHALRLPLSVTEPHEQNQERVHEHGGEHQVGAKNNRSQKDLLPDAAAHKARYVEDVSETSPTPSASSPSTATSPSTVCALPASTRTLSYLIRTTSTARVVGNPSNSLSNSSRLTMSTYHILESTLCGVLCRQKDLFPDAAAHKARYVEDVSEKIGFRGYFAILIKSYEI
ncbi:hypothetical protein Fmac_020871 [Flemingia macrophylla]|uniref:Uncharacterized protein n=1 Tax=Flemingia macrophylla TaxID=520843 RepID=A0ABD1LVB8_9FABA